MNPTREINARRDPRRAYLDLVAVGYTLYGVGAASPFLRSRLGLSDAQTGLHSTAMAIGVVVAGIFASRLDRRWPPALVHLAAIGMLALAWTTLAWAPAFDVTLLATGGIGLGTGVVISHVNAELGSTGGPRTRERLARANVASIASAFGAPIVIAASVELGIGWQGALGPALAVAAVAAAGAPSLRLSEPRGDGRSSALPADYWRSWLLVVLVVAIEFSIVFWAATLVERQAGVATADATLVGSAFLAGMVAGRLMLSSGRAAAANPHRLVAAGLVVAIGGALVVWGSALPLLSAAGLFCAGLGVAIQYPLGVAIALDASAGRLGQAGARLTIASGGAILGAPLALGALADTVGVVAGWALIVVLGLAGLLVASLVRTDARRRAAALPEAQAIAAD